MQLVLSTSKPWNSNYCNEDGQVLYKAESPGLGIGGRIIKISRVLPPIIDKDAETAGVTELRDAYEHVAEIDYRVFRTSRITYRFINQSVSDFFRTDGYSFYGRWCYFF